MPLIQFRPLGGFFLKTATDAFLTLFSDPDGHAKYRAFLEGAKNQLANIEYSLGNLAGKGVIDEISFASCLSDIRNEIEDCFAGGWEGFTRRGSGCFGKAVNLELNIRAMVHSLGPHFVNKPDKDKTEQPAELPKS